MKKLLLLLLLSGWALVAARAQVSGANAVIKGVVTDSVKAAPLGYVTVGIREAGKPDPVKSTYTNDKGYFEITGLPVKPYEVVLAYVSFKSKIIKVETFPAGNPVVDLGKIGLAPTSSQLKEVEVTAQKLLIKQDIDKITYDVEADPESKSLTALDMLRKVPLITVDAEENIQLKGSGSYRVLVNGKTSSLFVRNPKDVLKSMPASSIKNIEVITNPPAKYEAEGVGGIINIITNKKNPGGYNGSINAGLRSPLGYNAGGYITVKTGKFGVSGYFGTNYYQNPTNENNLFRDNYNPGVPGQIESRLRQFGESNNHGTFNYADGQASYEIDSLNLLTANYSINIGDYYNNLTQRVQYTNTAGILTQAYNRFNKSDGQWHGNDVGLDYQKTFKRNKEQLLTISYKYNTNGEDSYSDFSFQPILNYNAEVSKTNNAAKTQEQTIQADYVQPFGKHSLEAGFKTILRDSKSDYFYARQQGDEGAFVIDPSLSNIFDYAQNIYGSYTSFSYKKEKWGLKVGGRLEQTTVNADFRSSDTTARQNYFNFIPSVALSRTLKNMKTLKLSYTQRIERPGLWVLNPYVNNIDPKNISYGNPDLVAATSHAFDLAYSAFIKGSSVNASLFYNFTNNSIQQFTLLKDDRSETTYGNIGKNSTLGTAINTNLNLGKKININLNTTVNYVHLTGYLNGALRRNTGVTGYGFGSVGYKFAKTWRASGNVGFNTPGVLLQGQSGGYVFHSVSLNKTFLKNDKAGINIFVSSPFQKNRRWFNEYQDPGFYQLQENYFQTRRIGISFNYRFGKLEGDIARKKRGINNDDVKSGGQGGGNNQ